MATLPTGPIVADASFLIGIAEALSTAARFVPVLARCLVTSVSFGEVMYTLASKAGTPATATEQIFRQLGVAVEAVDVDHVRRWPALKDVDARSRAAQTAAGVAQITSLSLADLTCLSFAEHRRLPVLTGDHHWTTLSQHGLGVPVFDFRDPAASI